MPEVRHILGSRILTPCLASFHSFKVIKRSSDFRVNFVYYARLLHIQLWIGMWDFHFYRMRKAYWQSYCWNIDIFIVFKWNTFFSLFSMLFSFHLYFLFSLQFSFDFFLPLIFVPFILPLSHPASTLLCFLHLLFHISHSLCFSTQVPFSPGSGRRTQTSSIATLQWVFTGLWGRRHAGLDPREKGRKQRGGIRWCLGTAEKVWWVPNGEKEEPTPLDSFMRVIIISFYPISPP